MRRIFSWPRVFLATLLRYPRVTLALGVVFLISLVWGAGPWLGITKAETRVMIIMAILLLWVLFLLWDQYRANRKSKLLEQSLQKQAQNQIRSTRPDHKERIGNLQVQFDKSVALLKQSKLGKGRKSSKALYVLPWYMFIGPPASGKSTALLHSGIPFPYQGETGRKIQGIGGTRNCDWWFTNDAILLDTAGRYVTEEEDQEEWLGFLTLLKAHRGKKPINGVLAAISISDLLQVPEEDLEEHAKTIRARIDELIQRLGIRFPVYLLFTKCDLLQGFVEFFEDFSKAERDQVWGATLPVKAASNQPVSLLFEQEFQKLCHALHARRMSRLSNVRGVRKMRDIYGFPLQLESGRERLTRFVELLFQPNAYQENPIFRGFYFISGTQEGAPMDRILGAVSRASGLSERMTEGLDAPKETKSYFIKNLFTDIVFPDQVLAGPTSVMARQRGYIRVGSFVASALFLLVALVGLSFSFMGNKHLIHAIQSEAHTVTQGPIQDKKNLEENITRLERLRARLVQLQSYQEEGVSLRLRGGLYQGEKLITPLRKIYFEGFHDLLVLPVQAAMERDLDRFTRYPTQIPAGRDSDYYYALLKAYIMMSDPTHLQPVYLEQWMQKTVRTLPNVPKQKTLTEKEDKTVLQQIRFYSLNLGKEDVPRIIPNTRLVRTTQRILNQIPVGDRLYAQIRRAVSEHEPYTLDVALGHKRQDVLTNTYAIPALFTEPIWRTSFQEQRKKTLDAFLEDRWVMESSSSLDQDKVEKEINKRYNEEYVTHWRAFLEATHVQPADSLTDAARRLEVLSGEESPLVQLLVEAAQNTNLEDDETPSEEGGMVQGLIEKVQRKLKRDTSSPDPHPSLSTHPVSLQFRSLHTFVLPTDPKDNVPLSQYTQELGKLHEIVWNMTQSDMPGLEAKKVAQSIASGEPHAIKEPLRNIERLIEALNPETRRVIGPLLRQPVQRTLATITGQASAHLNERWRAEVYDACIRSIAQWYPFTKGGSDASLMDVADFFHPQNGILWKFYESELKSFVSEGGESGEIKKIANEISFSPRFMENLGQGRLISEALFPRGSSDIKVTFGLYPYSTPGARETQISVDGETLRYRNEPQEWHERNWPGPSGSAEVSLTLATSARSTLRYQGAWGFFRLLDAGRITSINPIRYRVEWDLGERTHPVKVQYDLKAQSFKNPFKPNFFSSFRCIDKVT